MIRFFLCLLVATILAVTGSVILLSHRVGAIILTGPAGGPSGSCSQSTTFFNAVASNGATLDTTHHNAADTMICGLATDGVWATLDRLWIPAINVATGTLATIANMDWVSGTVTLVPHGSPTLTADAGYTGGADLNTTVWIDTGYSPATSGVHNVLNSGAAMGWSFTNHQSSGFAFLFGNNDGTNGMGVLPFDSSGSTLYGNQQSASSFASIVETSSNASYVVNRTGSGAGTPSMTLYKNGAAQTQSAAGGASTALSSGNIFLLSGDSSGSPTQGGAYLAPAFSVGGGLTATQVSSSGSTTGTGLVPRICTYLTTVHGSC